MHLLPKLFCSLLLYVTCIQSIVLGQSFSEIGRKHIDTLSSQYFFGRGYTHDGVNKSAQYLKDIFKHYNLKAFKNDYDQNFYIDAVNTFKNEPFLIINNDTLILGDDYIIAGNAPNTIVNNKSLLAVDSNTFIAKDSKLILKRVDKLTFVPRMSVTDTAIIYVKSNKIINNGALTTAHISSSVHSDYPTQNVIGYIKGTSNTDRYFVVTAHYDHIGGIGNSVYFPGANDNASGVGMMIALMDYYSKNPPLYNIVFMAFSGEELGLLGSFYYTQNPLFDLNKIDFLINLDLVGNGLDGITVVNALEFKDHFTVFKSICTNNHFTKNIIERPHAPNSDHYPFYKKGVPSFFIYTQGGSNAYHDIYDKSTELGLYEFDFLSQTVIDFFEALHAAK